MFDVEKQGAVSVLCCTAPLCKDTAASFRNALKECLGKGQARIVVDLADASHLDGEGLDALLDTYDSAATTGGRLCLAAASPLCGDILRVTGILEKIEAFSTVRQAVGSFSR